MPVADARLSLLTFPQRWEDGKLHVRALVLPKGNPLTALAAGMPAFADAALSVDAVVIPSLDRLPDATDAVLRVAFDAGPPDAAALFQELAGLFNIDPALPAANPLPTQTSIKKYLMPSYRSAFAFDGPRRFCFTNDAYECALKDARIASRPRTPRTSDRVTWGQVIAFALRHPELARRLGLIRQAEIDLAATNHFENGGWLYADLNAASDYAGDPALLARYAARIPPLSQNRPLFAAVLFPVSAPPDQAGIFDPVFLEAESYDDGFAKIVHGSQPITGEVLDTNPRGLPVIKSVGIRLGWDDEQIVTWMNRQITASAADPRNLDVDAPTGVAGYRIDVRRAGTAEWHSMCLTRGHLEAGDIPLGLYEGELAVQAVPTNLQGEKTGDYWLPAYFTTWRGGSLVISDPTAFELGGQSEVNQNQTLEAVGADAVPLRFGEEYEFRVRLMDPTGGGPRPKDDAAVNPAPSPIARVAYRRHTAPRAVELERVEPAVAVEPVTSVNVRRPRLGYPDIAFTNVAHARAALLADAPQALIEEREPAVPDPDVAALRVTVEVRDPVSGEHVPLYTTTRPFPADSNAPLRIEFQYQDFIDISALAAADPLRAQAGIGPLVLPTAREIRLSFIAVARPDPQLDYFGSEKACAGVTPATLTLRTASVDERALFAPRAAAEQFQAIFMQPEAAPGANRDAILALQGRRAVDAPDPAQRLARQLGLDANGLVFSGRPGRRTVFGCSAALRHTLAPDRSMITFATMSDLVRQWVVAIHVRINRDWTWDALAPVSSFSFTRDQANIVGTIDMPATVSGKALQNADRSGTELIFFDAIDPKSAPDEFPQELHTEYSVSASFRQVPQLHDAPVSWIVRLPVGAAPVQTPKLISAGIASSQFVAAHDYSSTEPREQMLWLEFDAPPADPQDRYFARVLAYGPDPLLLMESEHVHERREPPLPIDPELIRIITPAQSADDAGLDAMQQLVPSVGPQRHARHFLVPLPPDIGPESPELFGFFVYELRVGHDDSRWSTAQARFGPPLRVTGVQHTAPGLSCRVSRTRDTINVDAPYATPVFEGRNLRPRVPNTEIWVLLYAQVMQADGAVHRNVLLERGRAEPLTTPRGDQLHGDDLLLFGAVRFAQSRVAERLASLNLARSSRLSVLAAELLPQPFVERYQDPLGGDLGQVRILRTSPLCPVPEIC